MEKHFCPYCMSPVKEGEPCEACGLTAGTYSPSPHHLPPGTILMDRYLVGRVLGEGGFGITYIGCDLRLELKVAIKEYFPSDKVTRHAQASLEVSNYTGALAGNYERGKEKYLQEARTMARMNKQAEIVSVRDFFETNNTAYIVMEYVEGTTFKELVNQKGGRISAGELFHMIEPLFFALEEMHSTGLIHRDISPDNLMLEGGSVRLLDFGCARESAHGTETMTIALKHGYAPIEQYQHKGQGPWTDVYALCATMYYCLTGKVPQQSLDRLCEDELILPRKLGVDMTENQERALIYGMGIRPRRRYQSVQELYAALYTGVPAPEIEIGQSSLLASEPRGKKMDEPAPRTEADPEIRAHWEEKDEKPKPKILEEGGKKEEEAEAAAETKDAPDKTSEGETRKKTFHQVKIGAAVAAIACLMASPFLLQEKLRPTPKHEQAMSDQSEETEEKYLLAEAVSVTTSDEKAFRALLDGDAKAVIWDKEENIQLTGEALTLTKPLYIGDKASMDIFTQVTVKDGGEIWVMGTLLNRGFLQIEGDGLLRVEDGGYLGGSNSVFVGKKENLVVKDGGKAEIGGNDFVQTGFDRCAYVDYSEGDVFADAVHVWTGEQLRDAIDSWDVSAIVIDDDIKLEESFRHIDKSVMISEGVTVTAPQLENASLCFDGWYLVNYGTIDGTFQVGDWNEDGRSSNVINYGRISNDLSVESDCNLINLGQMTFGSGWMRGGRFCNIGELIHDGSGKHDKYLSFVDGVQFTNIGTIRIEGDPEQAKPATLEIFGDTELCNVGLLEIGTAGRFQNQAIISGYGRIVAAGGDSPHLTEFNNEGIIRLECAPGSGRTGSLELAEGINFSNEGLIAYPNGNDFSVPGNFEDYGGTFIPFAWGDNIEGCRDVFTAEELKDALEDDGCNFIIVASGGEITLEEELIVTKGIAMAWPSTFRFTGGGLTLKGEGAFLYDARLIMGGNPLTVSDRAALYTEKVQEGGDVRVENSGQIFFRCYEEDAFYPDTSISLESGGRILIEGRNKLEGRTVSLEDGICRMLSALDMSGSSISIGKNAELLIQAPRNFIDGNSTISNNGKFDLGAWEDCFCSGEIVNNNTMNLYVPLNLDGGKLINNGIFYVKIGDQSISGNGTIKNNGTFYSGSEDVLREFRGSFSGSEVQYQ